MRGSIWAVVFPVCPALLVPARFVSHASAAARAAARRFACACRVVARSSVHPSHPVNKFLHVKGGGNIFKNLDSLLGLKPLLVPPPKLLGRFTPLVIGTIDRLFDANKNSYAPCPIVLDLPVFSVNLSDPNY